MAKNLINNLKDLREAVHELKQHERLSSDTETYGPSGVGGLYPFHGSRAFSIIFATKTDEFYFNFNKDGIHKRHKHELQTIFDDPNRVIFFINALFDATILHFDGIEIKSRIVDGPSIARIEYNKHGKNPWDKESFLYLENLANYYEVQQKIDAVKKYIKENNLYDEKRDIFNGKLIPLYNKVPLDLMFEYGCGDVRSTFDVCTKIIKCINFKDKNYEEHRGDTPPMIEIAKNEILLTSVLVDMKIKGIRLWTDYIQKAIAHESKISKALHTEISLLTGGINLNSGKQVAEYLISKGVEVPRKAPTDHAISMMDKWLEKHDILVDQMYRAKTDRQKLSLKNKALQAEEKINTYRQGNYITDKKTLAKLMQKYPNLDFLSKITKAKEADKKIGTYYENFMLLKDEKNIIHCGLNQEATKTGRFSSNSPNLQNLHKEEWDKSKDQFLIRKSFIADEGYRLFFADYSQQEMIVMLDQAGEMSVIEKLLSGEYKDFYLATASVLKDILNVEISRKEAKAMALGLAYGQGKNLLAKSLNKTPDEAAEFKAAFFNALPKLKKFARKLENQVKWYGKIHNAFGRVMYLDKEESYKALNGYVQGTSADITKTAMIAIHKGFKEANLESRLALCIHDETACNIKIGEEDKAIPIIRKAMIEAYPYKHIPLKVDFEFSEINDYGVSSWGEKQEYEL